MVSRRPSLESLVVLWSFLATAAAWAGSVEPRLEAIIRGADLRGTQVSVCVVHVSSGQTLAAIEADRPMIPASNLKLLTTAAALHTLGEEFRFRTTLDLVTPAAGGTPSLVIRGSGDPALGDPDILESHGLRVEDLLDGWAQAVAATGVDRFERLVVDDRIFDDERIHEDWPRDQLLSDYCAPVAGLNFHENVIDVLPTPASRAGAAPRVTLFPPAPFLETSNRAVTGSRDAFWIARAPGSNSLSYRGTVRARPVQPYRVTLDDPPMFLGHLVQQSLREHKIEVGRVVRATAENEPGHEAQVKTLYVVNTALPPIVKRCNTDSQNMFAEALLKRLGVEATGRPGSYRDGRAAVRAWVSAELGADHAAGLRLADGSGLSRNNRVTARLLTDLLVHMQRDPELAETYRESLAVSGESGTLDRRFRTSPLRGKVLAKSGYINGVSALSGYLVLPAESGDEERVIAFSLIFNGFKPPLSNARMKAVQQRMLEAVAESVERAEADAASFGG